MAKPKSQRWVRCLPIQRNVQGLPKLAEFLEAGVHGQIGGRNGGVRATTTGAFEVTEQKLWEAVCREEWQWQSSCQARYPFFKTNKPMM